MNQFIGFPQMLMAVIRGTTHYDDMEQNRKKPLKTDEERFDSAMQAIFGDQYEPMFTQTSDFTMTELIAIRTLHAKTGNFRRAVRQVIGERLPLGESKADKADHDSTLRLYVDQARKHFQRNKDFYEQFVPIGEELENSPYVEEAKVVAKHREKIFAVLREAGWDI